jgi:hypothetical protein
MGGSSSKSNLEVVNNTTVINQDELTMINESINNFSAEAVVNAANSCSASITQLQGIKFKNINVAGDFNLDVNQSQDAAMTFSCVNETKVTQDIANGLVKNMMANLEKTNNQDILAKLDATAKTKQENGSISGIANQAQSNAKITNNITSVNSTKRHLENVVKNSVGANFKTDIVSNCIANINSGQDVQVENVKVGGNMMAAVGQKQSATLMATCMNKTDVGNKITNTIMDALDIKVKDENTQKATSDVKASASTEQINKGLVDEIFGGLSKMLGAALLPIIAVAVCCVVMCCIGCAFSLMGGGKASDVKDIAQMAMAMNKPPMGGPPVMSGPPAMSATSAMSASPMTDSVGMYSPTSSFNPQDFATSAFNTAQQLQGTVSSLQNTATGLSKSFGKFAKGLKR